MEPVVSRKGKLALISYELPHRIYTAKVYPQVAPNGSTIILHGHTSGVRVTWRGGRPLKQLPKQSSAPPRKAHKTNGTTANDAIQLDSDSDDGQVPNLAPQTEVAGEVEYESEEEELDPSNPVPSIIQYLDLALESEVLHICTPKLPPSHSVGAAERTPSVFEKRIVFAATCIDGTIKVVTLPLSPPSEAQKTAARQSKSSSKWGEEVLNINNYVGHQGASNGIDMTWTSHKASSTDDKDIDMAEADDTPTVKRRGKVLDSKWDLLIASHNTDFSGLLIFFRIPIFETEGDHYLPEVLPKSYQTKYLQSPAVRISFSPNLFPTTRHTQLLVADTRGTVKIYDPTRTSTDRRHTRAGDVNQQATPLSGAWLGTFNTSFEQPKKEDPSLPAAVQRKRILDAKWTTGGQSIIMLLSDGEWGIWDIDHSGPKPNRSNAAKSVGTSTFAIQGYIGAGSSSTTTTTGKQRSSRSLAPMTPNTRRTREESLFHSSPTLYSSVACGSISVASLASPSGGVPEDSVLLRYGSETYRISNLAQFWTRTASGTGGSLYGSGLTRVEGIDTRGELINELDQFDLSLTDARMAATRDVLIVAEHRLLILANTSKTSQDRGKILFEKAQEQEERTAQHEMNLDHKLLAQGSLDLGGMDRLLEGMATGQSAAPTNRKVGFAA